MQKDFIDFLKSKVSIIDVISRKVKLRRAGKDLFGLCPFHSEKTGSFKVDPVAGYYYCFGCGAHGDIISFVMDSEKINFSEAVEYIANTYGIPIPKKEAVFDPNKNIYIALDSMKAWFVEQFHSENANEVRKYLETRKVSLESVSKFQLGFAPDDNSLLRHMKKLKISDEVLIKTGVFFKSQYKGALSNKYAGRLMFPILDPAGKCIGFGGRVIEKLDNPKQKIDQAKYINSPESEIFVKSNNLYGYSIAKRGKTREIILTEGYLDVISMHQAGFDGAVAPLGTSISEAQINLCWRVCDNPVILLDGDSAGIKASYRWIDKILSALKPGKSFKFAKLPQNSDPDMLIANAQIDVISESIKNASTLSEWMWDGAFMLYPSETPEQKAAIIKMLIEKTDLIKDTSIKKLYINEINSKARSLYQKKSEFSKKKINIRPVISVNEKIEKILIVTIINHPYIIDKVIEYFVNIEFGVFSMIDFKNRILDCYTKYFVNGDFDKYAESMVELEYAITDFVNDVELHASFAKKTATDDDAINGWIKTRERHLSDPALSEDLQRASSSLKSTFSEKDWQRLRALKKETILIKAKKQEL